MKITQWHVACLFMAISGAATMAADAPVPASAPVKVDPTVPAPKKDTGRFMAMHNAFLWRGKEGPMDLLFLGDSITEGWLGRGAAVWKKTYWQYHPANFGISGDRTEHVLWRIANGELNGISPKVVVLMIGTNNTASNSAEEIAAADTKIVKELREKLPETKVLLLAVFPRGPRKAPAKNPDGTPRDPASDMQIIHAVNAELAKLDDGKMVRYLDIGEKFMVETAIPDDIMPDHLHPNANGYQIWADAMQPLLDEMMK
jgi:beta-glucosidase